MQFTLTDLWAHMGLFARLIVVVLVMMSVSSVLITGERILFFRKSKDQSRVFASKVGPALEKGDIATAGKGDATKDIGYLGRVLRAGLSSFISAEYRDRDVIFDVVARAMERQAQREIQTLKRGQNVVATVASTAPFVGLLGTVMGIVNAFQLMAASGSGGLGTVSAGIAEALVTTAFGLLVAIPAVMAYNYLQGWVDARAVDMSESSNELLDVVARKLAMDDQAKAAE